MYSCDDLRSELGNLLDEDVAPAVRQQIEHHLAECRVCTVLVDSTRKTLKIVTDTGSFELPASIADRLTARIMEKVRKESKD